jgi:hypothetical protein
MNPSKPAAIVLIILVAMLVAAWALIIWVALQVSTVVLDTLNMIVELAAMT